MKHSCRSRSAVATFFIILTTIAAGFSPGPSYSAEEQDLVSGRRSQMEVIAELESVRQEVLAEGYSFSVGYNPAVEYTIEQLCGLKPPPKDLLESAPLMQAPVVGALPTAYDWRDLNGVTPIKDQLSCGSCWAFATVGVLEHQIRIQCGTTVDLSEQYLVSCNEDGYSCDGGWWAHDYHQSPGAVLESAFPYQGKDLACGGPYSYPYHIDSWAVLAWSSVPSVSSIKAAIYTYGSVAAGICVGTKFDYYTGGIFNADESAYCGGSVNHAITLVGWNDDLGVDNGYWILKNSWGTGWGESGYMRIRYNKSKVGYAASYVTFSDCGTSAATASLTVTLSPASAVSAGAKWRVDGSSWMNSGATVTGLSSGSHLLEFAPVSGWKTPPAQTLELTNSPHTATGTYTTSASSTPWLPLILDN